MTRATSSNMLACSTDRPWPILEKDTRRHDSATRHDRDTRRHHPPWGQKTGRPRKLIHAHTGRGNQQHPNLSPPNA
eukprot:11179437-Lingulodinium_polyedra.AAC.1